MTQAELLQTGEAAQAGRKLSQVVVGQVLGRTIKKKLDKCNPEAECVRVCTSSTRLCRRPRSSGRLSSRLKWRARLARLFRRNRQAGTDASWLWLLHSPRRHDKNRSSTRLECSSFSSSSGGLAQVYTGPSSTALAYWRATLWVGWATGPPLV